MPVNFPEKVPYIRTKTYEDQHYGDSIKKSQLISLKFKRKNKNRFNFPEDYEKYFSYKKMNEKVSFDQKIFYWVFNK